MRSERCHYDPGVRGEGSTAIVTSEGQTHDRSALATVRALAMAGRKTVVATSDAASLAARSRFAFEVCSIVAPSEPGFSRAIGDLEKQWDAITTFPTSDGALNALHPDTLRLMDKSSLAVEAATVGLDVPPTHLFASAEQLRTLAGDIGFPLIVKPSRKIPGGPIATRVGSEADLSAVAITGGIAQPFIGDTTRAIAGVAWGGRLVAVLQQRYKRTYPPKAGTASFAVSEPVDTGKAAALEGLLAGHDGIFQAQFVGESLIDVNLRPYGSMPLALAAGLNLPDIVCRLTSGEAVSPITARIGARYRWIDGDLRSLRAEVRAGTRGLRSAVWEAMPRPGTCHSIISVSDPLPLLVRLSRRTGS